MAMTGRTILGAFDEPAMADQAIDALQTAGFRNEQIHGAGHHASGGFMTGLKNFFTGEEGASSTRASDFTGMGVSNEEAQYYENESQAGHRVVAVQANGREQEAEEILRTNGAYNYGMQQATGSAKMAHTTTSRVTQGADAIDSDETQQMQLREEQLNVSKQRVQTGEVQLGKEVISEQKTINVPVTHEEAFIERRAVTGAATDTTPIGEGESIRVPLSEERVNVSKDTVVTGEVSISKRATEETRQVTDSVRREEARIEQEGDASIHGTKSDRFHANSGNEETL